MSGGFRFNAFLRGVVSTVTPIIAFVFLLRGQWPHALFFLAAGWVLNGVLAKLAFHRPDDTW